MFPLARRLFRRAPLFLEVRDEAIAFGLAGPSVFGIRGRGRHPSKASGPAGRGPDDRLFARGGFEPAPGGTGRPHGRADLRERVLRCDDRPDWTVRPAAVE